MLFGAHIKKRWLASLVCIAVQGFALPVCSSEELALHYKGEKWCQDDIKALCPNIKSGGGVAYKCLKESPSKLSKPCANVVSQMNNLVARGWIIKDSGEWRWNENRDAKHRDPR